MLVFAIKGNVMNYVITTISINTYITQSTCMITIKWLLIVTIGVAFKAHSYTPYIFPDPP